MRGFFVLFWLIMTVYTGLTLYTNWRKTGTWVGWKLANVFTKNIVELIIADLAMLATIFFVVPFQKLIKLGKVSMRFATGVQVRVIDLFF